MLELGLGLGMYCIGGALLGCVLAVPVAVVIVRQRAQDERLAQEAKERLRKYEAGEREAWRLPIDNSSE